MPVVTVSRELGSLGTWIAEGVGARLDAPCVDKEVLAEMARQAGVPVNEIVESEEKLLSRPMVVSEEMRAFFSRRGESGVLTAENYVERMSAAIRALAEQGNVVFVGRGAQMILAGMPAALHVHVYAAAEVRAARIQERRSLADEAAALQVVRQADENRRAWFRRFFTGANWKDPRYYDLMINTGRIPAQAAVELIVAAVLAEPAGP